jgi:hypothetical protein
MTYKDAAFNDEGRFAADIVRPAAEEKPYDELDQIVAYENAMLNEEEVVELFQHLVDNGHAWTLQGHYGRTATRLIEAGYVVPREETSR